MWISQLHVMLGRAPPVEFAFMVEEDSEGVQLAPVQKAHLREHVAYAPHQRGTGGAAAKRNECRGRRPQEQSSPRESRGTAPFHKTPAIIGTTLRTL